MLVAALVTAAIGNGLVAVVFFAFSSFVMPALARVTPAVGVHAMQSINIAVQRSMFLAEFMVTTALSAMVRARPQCVSAGPLRPLCALTAPLE